MSPCVDHGQKGDKDGYGTTCRKKHGKRSRVRLHRAVYLDNTGLGWMDIEGKVIRHKCDNPRCINPEHLEVGTAADNSRDMVERGRWRGGVPSQFTAEQVADIKSRYRRYSKDSNTYTLAKEYGVSQQLISQVLRR